MLIKTRAIVLRAFKFRDTKIIVDVFSEWQGRISLVCSLSLSGRGKFKKQLFQPLTLLAIEFDDKARGSLFSLHDVRVDIPYSSIPFNPYKSTVALFIAEFLLYATRGEQENPALYSSLRSSMSFGLYHASEPLHRILPQSRRLCTGQPLRPSRKSLSVHHSAPFRLSVSRRDLAYHLADAYEL